MKSAFFKQVNCSIFQMVRSKYCSASNKKLDKDNFKRDRTVYKDCYNKKKRKSVLITP